MHIQETLIAVIIFVIIFLFGYKIRLPSRKLHRWMLSFAAGVAVAYVFVHLLPELQKTSHQLLSVFEHLVYLAAMLGFLLSYGLEKMTFWSHVKLKNRTLLAEKHIITFLLHMLGYAAYVWLISYLMIRNIEVSTVSIILYTVALGLHFLGVDFYFFEEYGRLYTKLGRYILTVAVFAGWSIGLFTELHKVLTIILLGLVSGAIIMNTMIMELPQGKEGKFYPFLLGGVFYAALLLSIG
jgi:hypothetical protein